MGSFVLPDAVFRGAADFGCDNFRELLALLQAGSGTNGLGEFYFVVSPEDYPHAGVREPDQSINREDTG